jgi:hypothetical protein
MTDQQKNEMGGCESTGGDCMSWVRKRYSRARFGILLIIIGLLWYGQRAEWFPSKIFGPLVLLTFGIWMIAVSILHKRQATSAERDQQ